MLEIKSFTFGPFATNTYVISSLPTADEDTNSSSLPSREGQGLGSFILLVDPACSNQYEQQQLYNYISSLPSRKGSGLGSPLTIIATHGHLDHLWGAAWACEQWNTPVLMHEADIPMAKAMQDQYDLFGIHETPSPFPIENLTGAAGPTAERSYSTTVLQCNGLFILPTPGHTPGSISLYFPATSNVQYPMSNIQCRRHPLLFSGDTLFRMGYGRTDLPGGNTQQLIQSLNRLFTLPPDTIVYPGHGDFTTIAAENR